MSGRDGIRKNISFRMRRPVDARRYLTDYIISYPSFADKFTWRDKKGKLYFYEMQEKGLMLIGENWWKTFLFRSLLNRQLYGFISIHHTACNRYLLQLYFLRLAFR